MSKLLEWAQIGYDDLKRNFFATKPKEVDGVANQSTFYWRRKLYRMVQSRFKLSGVPETWDIDYFYQTLLLDGIICITDTVLGVLPLACTTHGVNVFRRPTTAIIANSQLGTLNREIKYAEDLTYLDPVTNNPPCALIYFNPDRFGIDDVLTRYAVQFAMADSGICVNLMNSKVTFVGLATSKAQAQTMQKMYDEIAMGKPAVFVKGDQVNGENFFFNHVKESFIVNEIQVFKRALMNEFLTDIGLNNANLDKRERLNSEEVNANNEEIKVNVQVWIENINRGLRVANELYGLDLKMDIIDFDKVDENELTESD